MQTFEPTRYPPVIAELLREERLAPLGPGSPNKTARDKLKALSPETAFAPSPVTDPDMARACLAGLWLYHDFLDEAHTISQDIATATGSYWHGMMHRREPDASNAAYWFQRVGAHPIFADLAKEAQELGLEQPSGRWDLFAFIDLCEQHRGTGTAKEMLLRRVQQKEWELLFAYSFQEAVHRPA